jgi:uncharacterized membrane protein
MAEDADEPQEEKKPAEQEDAQSASEAEAPDAPRGQDAPGTEHGSEAGGAPEARDAPSAGEGGGPEAPASDAPDTPEHIERAAAEKVAAEDNWPPEGEVSRDDRNMAMIAWLLSLFTGFIGPLVIYFMKKDESKFVAFHAMQCILFGAVAFVFVMIIVMPLAFVTCGVGSILVFLPMVVDIMWMVKANKGEWADLPVIADWARKFMADKE